MDLTQDWTPSDMDKEIENILADIVQTTAGGGKVQWELVEHIFEMKTGFALSALYTNQHTVPEGAGGQSTSTRKKDLLEYLKRILSEESTLMVNCEGRVPFSAL